MDAPATPKAKKTVDINVLRCLNPQCRALMAYEVDSNNVLYIDLSWTARQSGTTRYFPCPKCRGRNCLESVEINGKTRQRVARFEA